MIDTHTHLDLLADPKQAIRDFHKAGVDWVVTVGTEPDSIDRVLDLAENNPDTVRVAVGIHPSRASKATEDDFRAVETAARHPQVVAIGETGFDQYWEQGTLDVQEKWFRRHCDLARRHNLTLIIHTRSADDHTLTALREHATDLDVVLHCFSMPDRWDEIVDEPRWHISFAGNVTYPKNQAFRDVAEKVPGERLLLETDAPYLTPVPHRGEKNSPALIVHTYECVARERGITRDDLAAIVADNAERLFSR